MMPSGVCGACKYVHKRSWHIGEEMQLLGNSPEIVLEGKLRSTLQKICPHPFPESTGIFPFCTCVCA